MGRDWKQILYKSAKAGMVWGKMMYSGNHSVFPDVKIKAWLFIHFLSTYSQLKPESRMWIIKIY